VRKWNSSATPGCIAAGALVLAISVACGSSAARTSQGDRNSVVACLFAGDLAVYRLNLDGGKPVRLTPQGHDGCAPAWSPDGQTIAFIGEDSLKTMDESGHRTRQLFHDSGIGFDPGSSLAWSPDGRLIAFAGSARGIWLFSLASRTVSPLSVESDRQPSWSPSGKQIAFAHDATGNGDTSIWTMSASGASRRQLTHPKGRVSDRDPAWSPNGTQIAFGRDANVWVVDVKTGREMRVARVAKYPSWSPDGSRLAVFGLARGKLGLCVISSSGRSRRLLASGFWNNSSWRPTRS
jgi:TolB protein